MTLGIFTGASLPPLIDDFNRADGNLAAPWTNPTFLLGQSQSIISNQVRADAVNATYNAASYGSTTYTTLAQSILVPNIGTAAATNGYGLAGVIDSTHGYYIALGGSTYEVWRMISTFTMIDSGTIGSPLVNGDYLGMALEPLGANVIITLYKKTSAGASWSQIYTFTDTAASTAKGAWLPGITATGPGTARMDDFCVNDGSQVGTRALSKPNYGNIPKIVLRS